MFSHNSSAEVRNAVRYTVESTSASPGASTPDPPAVLRPVRFNGYTPPVMADIDSDDSLLAA